MTGQFLEYAASGRLIELRAGPERRSHTGPIVAATIAVGIGSALVTIGLTNHLGVAVVWVGLALLAGAISVLARAVKALRSSNLSGPLRIRPGAVLPPDLVRPGNWIHRGGAWVRIDHVGRDGGGRVHALLGSGELIELRTPVTVAGDEFRPVTDPVESLRR